MIKTSINNKQVLTVAKKIHDEFNDFNNKSLKNIDKQYKFEILLMTNSSNKAQFLNIIDWIYWHLNVIGFEHITIVHNNCPDKTIQHKLKNICNNFKQVSYYYESVGSQEFIYNKYLPLSKSKYTICIDEDEYIYIKNNKKIQDIILDNNYYKFSLPMVNFYTNTILKFTSEPWLNVFNYIYQANNNPIDDNIIFYKVLVDNKINHYVINDPNDKCCNVTIRNNNLNNVNINEVPLPIDIGLIHNPCSILNGEYLPVYNMYTKKPVYNGMINEFIDVKKSDIFIAHYKYRTESNFITKINNNQFVDVSNWYYNNRYKLNIFYQVYNNKDKFTLYNDLSNQYNTIKKECSKLKNILI